MVYNNCVRREGQKPEEEIMMKKMNKVMIKEWFLNREFENSYEIKYNKNLYFALECESTKAVELKIFKPDYPEYPTLFKWIPKSVIENLDYVLDIEDGENMEVKTGGHNDDNLGSRINEVAMEEARKAQMRYSGIVVSTPEYYGGEWPEKVVDLYNEIKDGKKAREKSLKIREIFAAYATVYAERSYRAMYNNKEYRRRKR